MRCPYLKRGIYGSAPRPQLSLTVLSRSGDWVCAPPYPLIPLSPYPWRDVLELFLFIHPTTSIAPTLKGVCDALDIPLEAGIDARILLTITTRLEEQLASLLQAPGRRKIGGLLQVLHHHRWSWVA
ncbi:MAG: hypothetical protein AAYR33_05135 [Acetobacteraceae bacterium]